MAHVDFTNYHEDTCTSSIKGKIIYFSKNNQLAFIIDTKSNLLIFFCVVLGSTAELLRAKNSFRDYFFQNEILLRI